MEAYKDFIKRISYLYREKVGRFFVLDNHGKMIEI